MSDIDVSKSTFYACIERENDVLKARLIEIKIYCQNQIQQCDCAKTDKNFDEKFDCIELQCGHYLATKQAKHIVEIIEELENERKNLL